MVFCIGVVHKEEQKSNEARNMELTDTEDIGDDNDPNMQHNYESNVFNNFGPNFFDNVQPMEKNANVMNKGIMSPTSKPNDHYFYYGNVKPFHQAANMESAIAAGKETRVYENDFNQNEEVLLEDVNTDSDNIESVAVRNEEI